jgi:lipopolysaccharide transport system ATP-binding protein
MSVTELNVAESVEAVAPEQEKHVVLELENVSKRFCRDLKRSLYYGVKDIGRELVGLSQKAEGLRKNEFWAVQDISFQLQSGDALGIIGLNGCGKTTLMRIISGLIKPTTGKVTVRGRLAPLLALGAGFNPVLTGRENIFANMSILGLTYQEIEARFDSVVDFSEIGYAIDAPVQTYSSGMVARLGFACAINTQPDILLLDEVLAVGDRGFRRKCLERLFEMRSTGMSLVMVHHAPGMLLSIADSALYLKRGRVINYGPIAPVIQQYERDLIDMMPAALAQSKRSEMEGTAVNTVEAEIEDIIIEPVGGGDMMAGCDAVIRVPFKLNNQVEQVNFTISVYRLPSVDDMNPENKPKQILKMISRRDGGSLTKAPAGEYEVRLDLPALGLKDAAYQVYIKIAKQGRVMLAARFSESFVIAAHEIITGEYHQTRKWSVIGRDGKALRTEKVLNSVENADDMLDLEERDRE